MIESKSFGSKAFKVINAIILILLAFSCFYPLWYTFCVSISSKAAAEGGLVTVYPIGPNVKSYSLIMGDSAFWNSFWISIKRVVIGLSLFGFMGVIFGPLLISIFILCVNIFKEQYLK